MCSCKSKEVITGYSNRLQMDTDLAYLNGTSMADTTKTIRSERLSEDKRIVETLTIIEYDKESGAKIKEIHAKRETAQDSDKAVSETEERGVTDENLVLVKHDGDFSKTIDSEEKLESIGGQESFGKWFGIGFALIIGLFLLYLWKKISR